MLGTIASLRANQESVEVVSTDSLLSGGKQEEALSQIPI
jgi:hypothetical protein